jgi:hypothetical protein
MGMITRNINTGLQPNPVVYADAADEQAKAAVKVSTAPPLDLKTRQIQRQGIFQAVVSNPGLLSFAADLDAFKVVVRELTEYGIEFVNEGGK